MKLRKNKSKYEIEPETKDLKYAYLILGILAGGFIMGGYYTHPLVMCFGIAILIGACFITIDGVD